MKILFITSTRIGDAVLSTGLLDFLLRTYPEARVTVACGPHAAPLFAAVPNLDRVLPMPKGRWARHWFNLWRACVGTRWDMVLDLRRSAIGYFLRAGQRLALQPSPEPVHRVRQIADVLALAEPPAPRLWITEAHRTAARRLIPDGLPVLAIGPTTNWRAKTWRAENFVALMARLTSPQGILPLARVAVFGSADERDQAQPVLDALTPERGIDLVGSVDLLTAYACLERCRFYVGNDSALMHIAATAGIPTLGLFGPTQETLYGPWSWNAAVVRTSIPFDQIFPAQFDHRAAGSLMDSLSVDAAEEAALRLWRATQGVAA